MTSFGHWDQKSHFFAAVRGSSKKMSQRFPAYIFFDDLAQPIIDEYIIFLDLTVADIVLFDVHVNQLDSMQLEQLLFQLVAMWGKGLGVVLVLAVFHRIGYTVIVDH